MWGDDDDNLSGIDFDMDGDHDIIDDAMFFTFLDELEKEDNDDFDLDIDDDWRDDCDDGDEFGINPEDYDSLDEYEEALEEAKYLWRDNCEDGSDYDIDPEDFETLDEYTAALEEAKIAWRDDCEDGSRYGLYPEDYDTLEDYEDALSDAKSEWRDYAEDGSLYDVYPEDYDTEDEYYEALAEAKRQNEHEQGYNSSANTSKNDTHHSHIDIAEAVIIASTVSETARKTANLIYSRKRQAKSEVRDADNGEYYGDDESLARCKFIAEGKSVAAKYLTVEGYFLFAQAVKDHFKVPFEIPDEKDEVVTPFLNLMKDLALVDIPLALKAWHWCLTNFTPYMQYTEDDTDLTFSILLSLDDFKESFTIELVKYMSENADFTENLILHCTDTLYSAEDLIVTALQLGKVDTAKQIIRFAFDNPILNTNAKMQLITDCIDLCSPWQENELETMLSFRENIFPIAYEQEDVRFKCKIPEWEKDIAEYISAVEKNSDKYLYSRSNAWRNKYRDDGTGVDVTCYDTEKEYLQEVERVKYSWRKYSSNRFGIDPNDYETREDYNAAVNQAYSEERAARQRDYDADKTNTTLYSFCKVATDFPNRPFLYYLTGKIKLKTGDKVLVPLGNNNEKTEGIVVAVGECFGASFPCPVSKLKTVLCIVPDDAE